MVARNISNLTVTPTLPAGASVSYNPADTTPSTPALETPLKDGKNTITVTVTAEDGRTKKTYTITVTRPGPDFDNATLSALRLSHGTLSPTFSSATTEYSASVGNGVRNLTVFATPTASGATARIGTDEIPSGGLITVLNVGSNTITVTVTAEDGTTTEDYEIIVTRADVPATDASLGSLSLSPGTLSPAFNQATNPYTAFVPHATAVISVFATPTASEATVAYTPANDSDPNTNGHQVALNVGSNAITVRVTSKDGTVSPTTYTITVTRGAAPATDTTLRSLSLSAGTLSPAFNPATTSYTAKVYYEVDEITVTATKNASSATVGITPTDSDENTRGHQVDLNNVGDTPNTITVTVTNGGTQNYIINVTRRDAASVEARLTGLTLVELGETDDKLSPAFDADARKRTYTASVAHTVGFVTVTATAADCPAPCDRIAYDPSVDAIRAEDGHQVELRDGQTRDIIIEVTSRMGATPKGTPSQRPARPRRPRMRH